MKGLVCSARKPLLRQQDQLEAVMSATKETPWFLWPFEMVWKLLAFVLKITGRLLAGILGVGLMAAGITAWMTVIGAPVGIPLAILGFLLIIRSIF